MNKKIVLTALMVLATIAVPTASRADGQDGTAFLKNCRDALRSESLTDEDERFNAGICYGFVLGVRQTLVIWQQFNPDLDICIPTNVRLKQLVQVFVKYMEINPEQLHYSASVLLIAAAREEWPCEE